MIKIWSWRQAIIEADLKPTTKHLLLTLSVYMNEVGQSCYPNIETICKATGLSNRAVLNHIEFAKDAGFLIVNKHGFKGQKWARNEYSAKYPNNFDLQKGSELGAVLDTKGSERDTKGSELGAEKAVNEVHTNTVYNNTPINTEYMFDIFYKKYPKKVAKEKAKQAFKKIIEKKKIDFNLILIGLDKYIKNLNIEKTEWKFIQQPATWLNGGCWEDEYKPTESKKITPNNALAGL